MINWKLRLKNKVTLVAICSLVVGIVFEVLALAGIGTSVTQDEVLKVIGMVLDVLGLLGVITDPTTKGLSDSTKALQYAVPREDTDYMNTEYKGDEQDDI